MAASQARAMLHFSVCHTALLAIHALAGRLAPLLRHCKLCTRCIHISMQMQT